MRYSLDLVRTDRGRRITITREVDAPADTVWELLVSVADWPAWGPPVTAVDYPDDRISAGTTGLVQAFGVFWVPFRIESVTENAWTWTAWGRTPPADGHRVEPVDDDHCRAVLECPLWAPWYLLLCAVALYNVGTLAEHRSDGRSTQGEESAATK